MNEYIVGFTPFALRALDELPDSSRQAALNAVARSSVLPPQQGMEVAGLPGVYVVRVSDWIRALVTYEAGKPTVQGIFSHRTLATGVDRLASILTKAGSTHATAAEARALETFAEAPPETDDVPTLTTMANQVAPGLMGRLAELTLPKNAGEFWGLISVILALVAIIIAMDQPNEQPKTIINVSVDATATIVDNSVATGTQNKSASDCHK